MSWFVNAGSCGFAGPRGLIPGLGVSSSGILADHIDLAACFQAILIFKKLEVGFRRLNAGIELHIRLPRQSRGTRVYGRRPKGDMEPSGVAARSQGGYVRTSQVALRSVIGELIQSFGGFSAEPFGRVVIERGQESVTVPEY